MSQSATEHIVVLGGGAIGVCCAYYLALDGKPVTLLEKQSVASGCSYGNVGLVALSHCVPLAAPGVVGKALKWMFDPSSPFYLKPRLDWSLFAWLLQFVRACNESQMRRSMAVLRDLTNASIELYDHLANHEDLRFGYQHSGLLGLFCTESGMEEARVQAQLLREFDIDAEVLTPARAQEREPLAGDNLVGGLLVPGDRSLIPSLFVQQVCRAAEHHGARIHTDTAVGEFSVSNGEITAIQTSLGEIRPSTVVLAAGAWSTNLAKKLRVDLPIQPGKGYSVALPTDGSTLPKHPVLLGEAHVILTPMNDIVRVGGTMELAGMNDSINMRRVHAVLSSIPQYLSRSQYGPPKEIWSGLRPCTPDGLPILGLSPNISNLMIATGHGMLGITLAPITGRVVADVICGRAPLLDVKLLGPQRFS